ncbi:MAG: acetyl-CoA C-acyltransferase, partial [Spirochaetales bacterium]|nr:acetyl-CoA C-acyltransferase [Spirochaetales bacterium]
MKPVIVSALRTPIGAFGGMLKDTSPIDFASMLIRELTGPDRLNGAPVDEVIIGQVLQAGLGQNPARQAA